MAEIIPIPAFADNYIWLLRSGNVGAIVDPGDAAPVIAALERSGISPCAILATHHHGDHVGGNPALLARWQVPVFGPSREKIPGRTQAVSGGDRIVVPGIDAEFDVIDVPGHTAGHVAYFGEFGGSPVLFCGDTLFAGGCGRVFDGTFEQLSGSLRRIAALPPETRVYCAHEYTLANLGFAKWVEPDSSALVDREREARRLRSAGLPTVPSRLALELATNPFLRTGEAGVIAAAEGFAGRALHGHAEVFTALRRWKDQRYD
jgi:hydroxyacylglutathione hydrolase